MNSVNERFELIKPYIEDKDVLDVGCCDWCEQLIKGKNRPYEIAEGWLHGNIKKYAKNALCIDVSKDCVEFLKDKGHNVKVANAENFELNKKFDVIVAGELIEHLSNFQGFFESVKKHLRDGGLLILSTPNMFYFKEALFLALRGYPSVNPDHTCWFDEITLRQLLDRFGYSVVNVSYTTEGCRCTTVCEKLKEIPFRLFERLTPFKKIKYGTIIVVAGNKGK